MTELNDLYDYGLKIYQNSDYFKFSIDSILLAEFVKCKSHDRVLDICTGNAPIPLILANYDKMLKIDGLEIQEEVYNLATKSVQENGLDQITIYNCDAKTYDNELKYDVITCNPPYFKVTNTSQKNDNPIKRIARHEILINLNDIITVAKRNLKETGTFYMVHRTERLLDVISNLENEKFGIRNIVFIYTKKDKKAEFFLIEASKYKKSDPKIYSVYTEGLATYQGIFREV